MICLNFIGWSYFPCLKTINLMFHFALNKPETGILATNVFLGVNVMERIRIIAMIFSASWHLLVFIYPVLLIKSRVWIDF